MSKIRATEHAQKRMQQRGISEIQVKLIEIFGDESYQKGGSYYAHIPERVIVQLRHALDNISSIAAIYGDGDKVITVMHETRQTHKTQYIA